MKYLSILISSTVLIFNLKHSRSFPASENQNAYKESFRDSRKGYFHFSEYEPSKSLTSKRLATASKENKIPHNITNHEINSDNVNISSRKVSRSSANAKDKNFDFNHGDEISHDCQYILKQFSSMCRCISIEEISPGARKKRTAERNIPEIYTNLDKIYTKQDLISSYDKSMKNFSSNDQMLPSTENNRIFKFIDHNSRDNYSLDQHAPGKSKRDDLHRSYRQNQDSRMENVKHEVQYRLECSCDGDLLLVLPGIGALPSSVKQLRVSDCRGGQVVVNPSSTISDSNLNRLSFINVKELIIRGGALDMHLRDDPLNEYFVMELENIGKMTIDRGAIRFSGNQKKTSFIWRNIVLESLPSFSVTTANMVSFIWDGILIIGRVETAAMNLESSKTFFKMDEIDARAGMDAGWLSGDLAELNISRSRLNLAPGAFQRITFSETNSKIIMRNNVFGNSQWSNDVFPSLAARVFDFTFKDESAHFNIAKNEVQCELGNLEWLMSPKTSVVLHWLRCGLLKTLSCLEGNISLPYHPDCNFHEIEITTKKISMVTQNYTKEIVPRDKRSFNLTRNEPNKHLEGDGSLGSPPLLGIQNNVGSFQPRENKTKIHNSKTTAESEEDRGSKFVPTNSNEDIPRAAKSLYIPHEANSDVHYTTDNAKTENRNSPVKRETTDSASTCLVQYRILLYISIITTLFVDYYIF